MDSTRVEMNIMKRVLLIALLCTSALFLAASDYQARRQVYPLDPARAKKNALLAEKDLEKAPESWKNRHLLYYTVPPLAPVKRTQDAYPEDGVPFGSVDVFAAKGEYEPASIQLYATKPFDRVTLTAGDLTDGKHVIPASEIDLKVVKIWYQAGTAWYSHFNDPLTRVLIPELLLNDENLISVDPRTEDNYVRYTFPDGTQSYCWCSFSYPVTAYAWNDIRENLIEDAPTLQSFVLNPGEYKQFFITVHVPENAAAGIYRGAITVDADGQVSQIPLRVKVFPFELPEPRTNYDIRRKFHATLYLPKGAARAPRKLENLKRHNALNSLGMLSAYDRDGTGESLRRIAEAGLPTDKVFSTPFNAAIRVKDPAHPSEAEQRQLDALREAGEAFQKELGDRIAADSIYVYGIDEGGVRALRDQRAAWRLVHREGMKIIVSGKLHPKRQYALDFLVMAGAPTPARKKHADLFHEANPDGIVGWYSDPHSGPENPDYIRRLHGLQAWKMNYDAVSNYVWYRDNWNDFASTPYEAYLRGLMMVYPCRANVLDTLAWEGFREGLDDVRYVTRCKQLALEAAASPDADVKLLGRQVLAGLAFIDAQRDTPDAIRMEAIRYMERLESALKKGNAK